MMLGMQSMESPPTSLYISWFDLAVPEYAYLQVHRKAPASMPHLRQTPRQHHLFKSQRPLSSFSKLHVKHTDVNVSTSTYIMGKPATATIYPRPATINPMGSITSSTPSQGANFQPILIDRQSWHIYPPMKLQQYNPFYHNPAMYAPHANVTSD